MGISSIRMWTFMFNDESVAKNFADYERQEYLESMYGTSESDALYPQYVDLRNGLYVVTAPVCVCTYNDASDLREEYIGIHPELLFIIDHRGGVA